MKTLLTILTILTISAPDSLQRLVNDYHVGDTIRIEATGITPGKIRGLKPDTTIWQPASIDWMMLKCATSPVHFWGKGRVEVTAFRDMMRLAGRTSLAMCKPEVDWRILAGVDEIVPDTAGLPRADLDALLTYIARTRAFMDAAQPNPEVLLYLPRFDRRVIRSVYEAGYDMDYASAVMLDSIRGVDDDGYLLAPSGIRYRALVMSNFKYSTPELRRRVSWLEEHGATVIYAPDGDYAASMDHNRYLRPETTRSQQGLLVTRYLESHGTYRYFIVNMQGKTISEWVHLAVPFRAAEITDPISNRTIVGQTRRDSLHLSLRSGESILLRTTMSRSELPVDPVFRGSTTVDLTEEKWMLFPMENVCSKDESVWNMKLEKLCYWSRIWPDAVGTMRYQCVFRFNQMPKKGVPYRILLSLPDVHESAHVLVNGEDAGTLFAQPFQLDVTDYIISGKNTLEIDVTSLDANYIGTAGKHKTAGLSKVMLIIQN